MFASFYGVNIPTMAASSLPMALKTSSQNSAMSPSPQTSTIINNTMCSIEDTFSPFIFFQLFFHVS